MGDYTGLRFKGIVKEQFREVFGDIALSGKWQESSDAVFRQFGDIPRASFIPCGALAYMPDSWGKAPYNECGYGNATDGFERGYDKQTGRWTFQSSLKNCDDTIQEFFKIVPYFMESVEIAEVYYEYNTWSKLFVLIGDKMEVSMDRYIQYEE